MRLSSMLRKKTAKGSSLKKILLSENEWGKIKKSRIILLPDSFPPIFKFQTSFKEIETGDLNDWIRS